MRLDKFLKVSRIIKRRTIAKQLCEGGLIAVNGKVAKASTEVKAGDVIQIRIGDRVTEYLVNEIREFATVEEAAKMVRRRDSTS
ncbi:MAG: RNA-binding S4 domain-containing protein [Bacillota bacterium]